MDKDKVFQALSNLIENVVVNANYNVEQMSNDIDIIEKTISKLE